MGPALESRKGYKILILMHWASYLTPKVEFWLTKNALRKKLRPKEGNLVLKLPVWDLALHLFDVGD
jgi:hypothetical protein